MIGWLSGVVVARDPAQGVVVINVGGVGYEVRVSMQTLAAVGDLDELCTLWIHTYAREDALTLFGSITLALVGWLRRPATIVALLLVIYVSLVDPISAFTLNRLFIFSLLLLALAPATAPDDTMPAWPVRILQLTLVLHYATSGVCKSLRGDWLTSDDVLWSQLQNIYMTDAAALFVRVTPTWAMTLLQHTALGFELLAPLLFGLRRLRPFALFIGISMHIMIAVTMYQLFYFSAQMVCFYLLFLDPATLQRWRKRLGLAR